MIDYLLIFFPAEHYLSTQGETGGIYSESYENVAVLFASIPDFMESFKEDTDLDDVNHFLKQLNDIIRSFDMVRVYYKSRVSEMANVPA